jgi:ABC-type sugar transport system substrate-binding protein
LRPRGCQRTSAAEDILTANPDLKAIYSACGPPAAGAAQAITNAGIANDAFILVGFDACCGELEAIKSGVEDATVAQFPAKMANSESTRSSRRSRAKRWKPTSTLAPAL